MKQVCDDCSKTHEVPKDCIYYEENKACYGKKPVKRV